MSLRNQINIRMLIIVIMTLIAGGSVAIWKAKESVEEETSSSFYLVKSMLDFSFNQVSPVFSITDEHIWSNFISNLQETRHVRIEVVENNQVKHKLDMLNQQTVSPPPDWFITAVASDFSELQHSILLSEKPTRKVSIYADPSDEIQEAWAEFQTFFWSVFAILSVLFLTINTVFNYMFRAVQTILSSLKEITSGHFGHQLPSYNIVEFDVIANSINGLSSALKKAHENNQELTYHSLNIQEKERKTMAQELHDEMGQSITAIKAIAVATKHQNDETTVASDTIIKICNHLSGIVSSRMRTLHPLCLSDLGLCGALKNLIDEWQRNQPEVKVEFFYSKNLDELKNDKSIHLYRIIQESLTNIAKHSSATKVQIRLEPIDQISQISLTIKDNGLGIRPNTNHPGFGLRGMKERAESQGGIFSIEPNLPQGVCIKALMPLHG